MISCVNFHASFTALYSMCFAITTSIPASRSFFASFSSTAIYILVFICASSPLRNRRQDHRPQAPCASSYPNPYTDCCCRSDPCRYMCPFHIALFSFLFVFSLFHSLFHYRLTSAVWTVITVVADWFCDQRVHLNPCVSLPLLWPKPLSAYFAYHFSFFSHAYTSSSLPWSSTSCSNHSINFVTSLITSWNPWPFLQ